MSLAGARARLASVPKAPTRRAYSILSKPGGGRFSIAAKVSKAIGSPGSSTTTNPKSEGSDKASAKEILVSNAQAPIGDEQADKLTIVESKSKAISSSSVTSPTSSDKEPSLQSSATPNDTPSINTTQSSKPLAYVLEPHPKPTKEAVSLHNFFSLHRPLLLLPIHATQPIFTSPTVEGTIFEGIKTRADVSESQHISDSHGDLVTARREAVKGGARVPKLEVDMGSGRPLPTLDASSANQLIEDDNPEADADAARLLGRSYVLSRIGSVVDWQATLGRLGDFTAKEEVEGIKAAGVQSSLEAEANQVRMDSVKRKRKKKMNKHM